jgi:hypothetical protein
MFKFMLRYINICMLLNFVTAGKNASQREYSRMLILQTPILYVTTHKYTIIV